jgi:hypothetical protein
MGPERACRLCVLVDPPGIAKTRLAQELTKRAAGRAVVLRGACAARATYWLLLEVVRQAAQVEPTDMAERAREKIAASSRAKPTQRHLVVLVVGRVFGRWQRGVLPRPRQTPYGTPGCARP